MTDLENRVQRDGATERDGAIQLDIMQKYIDALQELEDSDLTQDVSVVVETDGTKIKFKDIEDVAKWLIP